MLVAVTWAKHLPPISGNIYASIDYVVHVRLKHMIQRWIVSVVIFSDYETDDEVRAKPSTSLAATGRLADSPEPNLAFDGDEEISPVVPSTSR